MFKLSLCFLTKFYMFICIFNIVIFAEIKESTLCLKQENCSSCIQIPFCAWCSDEKFISRLGRKCDFVLRLIEDGCLKNLIFNPKSMITTLNEDLFLNKKLNNFNSHNNFDNKKINMNNNFKLVQLKPNKIKINLRPNTKVRFNLTFEQTEKYPLDIYYLMDLTWSMKDHKDALITLAKKISESMSNITKNFRLGFGSFIDKVVMPYSNMVPKKLKNPCKESFACVPAYGFKNHLSLTNDVDVFLKYVKEAQMSANLDNAEGGFDAIMQVITCKDKINWSYPSRKIILFATDSIFHYAGDGKLGGIVKPNDGICHLDNDGYYTESIYQDYPTLEQINKAIINNQINIIFSVPKKALNVYKLLSKNLQGSVTGELAENSSNIVNLIKENYEKIVSTIKLKHNSSKYIDLKYYSTCMSKQLKETNTCSNVKIGQKIEFQVELQIKSCLDLINQKETFFIFPLGIEEYTEIQVEMICNCECEDYVEINSKTCSNHGNLQCGVCDCYSTYYGDHCECSQLNSSNILFNDCDLCLKGTCNCGRCICDKKNNEFIYGKYCECDTYSCIKNKQNEICSGNGRCCNNKCECFNGWSGEACDCPLDDTLCINPFNEKICSGQGECVCGKCECKRTNSTEKFVGRYCNECPTCEDECVIHDACVQSTAFETGYLLNNYEKNCSTQMMIVANFDEFFKNLNNFLYKSNETSLSLNSEFLDNFEVITSKSQLKHCVMIDEENCKYEFIYIFSPIDGSDLILILNKKKCPEVINVYYLMLLIIFIIILIGITILIAWKTITTYKDRKNYKNWLQELKKCEYTSTGINPLYKAPETIYKNPIYKSRTD